jgi:hypothetical protein
VQHLEFLRRVAVEGFGICTAPPSRAPHAPIATLKCSDRVTRAREIQDVTWVRAAVVVLISLLLAKIVNLVICRLLLRLAARSNTDLDDRLDL